MKEGNYPLNEEKMVTVFKTNKIQSHCNKHGVDVEQRRTFATAGIDRKYKVDKLVSIRTGDR
jgi:uncharacterized DUF497 family protein